MLSQDRDAFGLPPTTFEIDVVPTESRHVGVPVKLVETKKKPIRPAAKSAGQERLETVQ